jgi:hypothetical protein
VVRAFDDDNFEANLKVELNEEEEHDAVLLCTLHVFRADSF